MAQVEFELDYFEVVVQHFNNYAKRIPRLVEKYNVG